MLLIKYPIGMKSLPLFEKFGLNSPAGGFLDHQVYHIKSIIADEELIFLEKISDNDTNVKTVVKEIESLPDISEKELQKQKENFDDWINKSNKKSYD